MKLYGNLETYGKWYNMAALIKSPRFLWSAVHSGPRILLGDFSVTTNVMNCREKENYLSVAAIFFFEHSLLTWANNDVELNLPDFSKSDVGCRILTSQNVGFL